MKKAMLLTMLLVLTISVLAGCGCRNSKPAETMPTTMPTAATIPTTEMTTAPTTMATEPSEEATIQDGNGPLSTEETTSTDNTNARTMPGSTGGMDRNTGSGNGITGSITG